MNRKQRGCWSKNRNNVMLFGQIEIKFSTWSFRIALEIKNMSPLSSFAKSFIAPDVVKASTLPVYGLYRSSNGFLMEAASRLSKSHSNDQNEIVKSNFKIEIQFSFHSEVDHKLPELLLGIINCVGVKISFLKCGNHTLSVVCLIHCKSLQSYFGVPDSLNYMLKFRNGW